MATVTVRYWAAARAAAGVAEESITAPTLAAALAAGSAADNPELRRVIARSSFLVDGVPVGRRAAEDVALTDGAVVEVLPPFAGG